MISSSRGLIADPELPNKVAEGRVEDIRPCIYCNEGCIGALLVLQKLGCDVNAQAGMEREYKIEPAAKSKKVLVIGGGPSGMEAARVAALRGHRVALYEKKDSLGGLLLEASTPAHKKDIAPLIAWLSSQVKKAGATVVLGKEVTTELVAEMRPDVAIVAAGTTPLIPKIPGIQKPSAVTAIDVLLDKAEVGNEIIVAGGGVVGCDVAAFLADKGKKVTIVEMLSDIALDVELFAGSRGTLLAMLGQKGVNSLTDTKLEEITDEGAIVSDKEGASRAIKADTVVLALGLKPSTKLYEALKGKVSEIYAIGDSVEPRKIGDAIHEGFYRANTI